MDPSRFSFLSASRSTSNISSAVAPVHHRKDYPTQAEAYELLEECGRGVSATVWRAAVKTTGEVVAIKILDMETMNCSLDEIVREAQTMSQLNHPNLLPLLCSFVYKQNLWMVMPYIQGGSVLNIMRFRFPDGLDEPVIATIMKEVLKALEYLHRHEIIHRDIKAGNILLDNDGHVLLADFGVAATLERGGSWGNKVVGRNTFVGTPCWMAPEVMEQNFGYDIRADIWSFGITLLELAHGHAPFARLPPMKVLLMTLQNPPPTLDMPDNKKAFSKAMKDLVAKCLIKDPTQRPTAAQLLDHKFFKSAHDSHYLVRHVLEGLPSVSDRVQMMRQGHGPQHQALDVASQQEYRKGVSQWNFDVKALKEAAAKGSENEEPPIGTGLASISETSEFRTSSEQEADLIHAAGMASPTKVGSPDGERPLQTAAGGSGDGSGITPGTRAAGGGVVGRPVKEHGRFKVYEDGEQPPPFSSPADANGAALMEEHNRMRSTTPSAGASDDTEADKAKRKGRFRYVEDDFGADGKPRIAKAPSQVTLSDQRSISQANISGTASTPPITIVLPQLKEVLESITLQQETMRELVAAVSDAERGKQAALNAFVQQRQSLARPSREEVDKLRAELNELREENAKLKAMLREQSMSSE